MIELTEKRPICCNFWEQGQGVPSFRSRIWISGFCAWICRVGCEWGGDVGWWGRSMTRLIRVTDTRLKPAPSNTPDQRRANLGRRWPVVDPACCPWGEFWRGEKTTWWQRDTRCVVQGTRRGVNNYKINRGKDKVSIKNSCNKVKLQVKVIIHHNRKKRTGISSIAWYKIWNTITMNFLLVLYIDITNIWRALWFCDFPTVHMNRSCCPCPCICI